MAGKREFTNGETMATLERAIAIAAKAHEGQVDKAGAPYILHPLRVMLHVATIEERIAAVLHDVVEDTEVTLEVLRKEGFSEEVVNAIDSLTRRPEEDYDAFVARAASNPIGRQVKLADMEDNSDLSRIPVPSAKDYARAAKYRRAIDQIKAFYGKGA
jgi:(p)ppGpp synthase/HD superfamily hydrolase